MSTFFNKIRGSSPRGRISGGREVERQTDLPLDHQLTFSPEKDEKWTFSGEGKILLNDVDVNGLVNEGGNNIGLLCGVSQGLTEYREFVWSRGGKGNGKFNGTILSLQDKVMGRLGSIYDGITGGVRFECDGDNFWINNVNVSSVLNVYRRNPTDKARRYLMGLRDKVGLILSSRQASTRYDGVSERARALLKEINRALEYLPTDAPLCLGSGRRVN